MHFPDNMNYIHLMMSILHCFTGINALESLCSLALSFEFAYFDRKSLYVEFFILNCPSFNIPKFDSNDIFNNSGCSLYFLLRSSGCYFSIFFL